MVNIKTVNKGGKFYKPKLVPVLTYTLSNPQEREYYRIIWRRPQKLVNERAPQHGYFTRKILMLIQLYKQHLSNREQKAYR